eukprot:403363685
MSLYNAQGGGGSGGSGGGGGSTPVNCEDNEYKDDGQGNANVQDESANCYQCENKIWGCQACNRIGMSSKTYIECTKCHEGLYLLTNETNNNALPNRYSMCVPDCTKAHSSYVNDPVSGSCRWCGQHCSSCDSMTGCESCQPQLTSSGFSLAFNSTESTINSFFNFAQCTIGNSIASPIPNCITYDTTKPRSCKYCENGYFKVDMNNDGQFEMCKYSNIANCVTSNSLNQCDLCSEYGGFSNALQMCRTCAGTGSSTSFGEYSKCSITGAGGVIPDACKEGYVDSNNQCVTSCKSGQFGLATYSFKQLPTATTCTNCNSTCFECMDANFCFSCRKGYYLEHQMVNGEFAKYGYCKVKTSVSSPFTSTIYVTAAVFTTGTQLESQLLKDGSISSPFNQIQDAISKANELGAPYTSALITILLNNVDNAYLGMLRTYYQHYKQMYSDYTTQSTKILIDVTDSSTNTPLIVYYKLKDKWTFNVGGGLEINNVQFDAIDSILQSGSDTNNYLKQELAGCSYSDRIFDTTSNDDCNIKFPLTEECVVPKGASFFKFDLTNETSLTSPATLKLNNVGFKHFFYEFNSFIDLNDYGGYVEMSSVSFQYFESCGALLRNKKYRWSMTQSSTDYSNNDTYAYVNNFMQYNLYTNFYDVVSNPFAMSCTLTQSCFSVKISSSTFQNFNKQKQDSTTPLLVDPLYKLKYRGLIIDLENFAGKVEITDTTFQTSAIGYSDCSNAMKLDANTVSGNTDNFSNYGTKSVFQIKAVISIVNHKNDLILAGNTFQALVGTKSPIYLDILPSSSYMTVIVSNTFNFLGGYIDASAIYLRLRSQHTNPYNIVPNLANNYCTGPIIQSNTFIRCHGCQQYVGAVLKIECVGKLDSSLKANDRIDSTQWSTTVQNLACLLTKDDFSSAPTLSYTHDSTTYTIDTSLLTIVSNSFTKSSFSNGHAVLDIIGVPRVKISDVSFSDIVDATKESLSYFNQEIQASSDDISLSEIYSSSTSPISIDKFGVGMVKVQYVSYLYASGLTSTSNALIEPTYSSSRALLLYVDGVYGQVELGKQTVTNHLGFYQLTENDKSYTDFTSNKEWGNYEVSNMQVGTKYTVSNSTLKDGTFLPINKITTNRCLVSSSIDLSDSSYQYIMLQHHDSNDQAYIIDTMTQNGREYEFESFTMINTFLNDTDLSDNYFLNKVECLGCTFPLFRLSAKTIDIQYANFSSIGEFYSSEDNKSKYYINAPVFKIYMRQPFKKQIDTDWTVEKVSFTDININSCYGYYDFHFFDIEQQTNFKDPLGNDITSYDLDISSDEQLIFGYDVNNTAFNIYSLGNGAFAYINLPDMMMSISSFQIESVQANYQNELQSIGGSFLFLEHLVKLTMVDVMGQDFEISKNSSNLLTEGALIYYNDDAPFELDMSLERYNQDLGGLNCSRTQDGTNSISSTILNVKKASMIYLNGIDSKITLNVDTYSFGYCIGAEYGGVFRIESSVQNDVTISDAVFSANSAMKGGDIYCKNCYISLSGIQSEDGKANEGGSMYLDKPVNSNFMWSSFIFEDMEAFNYGGSIYINSEESDQDFVITFDSLEVINSWEYGSKAGIDGGFMYLNIKRNLDITFDNCTLDGTQAGQNGGGFQLDQSTDGTLDLTISNSVIKKSKSGTDNSLATGHGGFVYTGDDISETTVTITNTTFTDCQASSNGNGGTFYLGGYNTNTISISSNSSISLSSTSQQAINGGFAYLSGSNNIMTISSTQASGYNFVGNGGFLYMTGIENQILKINGSTSVIQNMNALESGGVFYIEGKDIDINIDGSDSFGISFASFDAGQNGGWLYVKKHDNVMDSSKLDIYMDTVQLQQSKDFYQATVQNGGVIYVDTSIDDSTITIKSSEIQAFSSELGSWIYYNSDSAMCSSSPSQEQYPFPVSYSNLQSDYYLATGFNFDSGISGTITSYSNIYENCWTTSQGAIFNLEYQVSLEDSESTYYYLSASQGGILYCDACTATFNQSTIQQIIVQEGGIAYVKGIATVIFNQPTLFNEIIQDGQNNLEGNLGVLFYIGGSMLSVVGLYDCQNTVQSIYADDSSILAYSDSQYAQFTVSNCQFSDLTTNQGNILYSGSFGEVNLINVNVSNSATTNTSFTGGQYATSSTQDQKLVLTNFQLECQEQSVRGNSIVDKNDFEGQVQTQFDITGGQITATEIQVTKCGAMKKGILKLTTSTFSDSGGSSYQNIFAQNGGFIYSVNSNITITDASFNGFQTRNGNIIYSTTTQASTVSLNGIIATNFMTNDNGGLVYSVDNTLTLSITNAVVSAIQARQILYLQ